MASPGKVNVVKPTITVDTAIYAALDILGAAAASGVIPLTGAMRQFGGTATLQSLSVFDDDNEKAVISFLFFDGALSGGTYVGNGALALSTADKAKYIGKVNVASADYETLGGEAFACIKNINLPVAAASGSSDLYVVPLVTSGTPTFTAATDLKLAFGFQWS